MNFYFEGYYKHILTIQNINYYNSNNFSKGNLDIELIVLFLSVLVMAVLFWPKKGFLFRWLRLSRLDERVCLEDSLKYLFNCQESGQECSVDSLAGRLVLTTGKAASLLSKLSAMELVQIKSQGPILTEKGGQSAIRIVRTHRLWERYLADRTGVPPKEWHNRAERMEHSLSAEETNTLESRLGHPSWDPHGDPIPDSSGIVPPTPGTSLVNVDSGKMFEVVHLEDEPEEIYYSLLDKGFVLGDPIEVVSNTEEGIVVRIGGQTQKLDTIAAHNVNVRALPKGKQNLVDLKTLFDVEIGNRVRVVEISRVCQGAQRRRLLDLGIVRGTEITPTLASAVGNPVAYEILGSLIALRSRQAKWIRVESV